MTIRKRDLHGPVDAHPSSRDAAALPIVLELAVLLESVALLLPDGAERLPEVAAGIFTKRALLSGGTESCSAGEIVNKLFREVPILMRSWAPNVPECSTFVLQEDGVAAWLRRWARADDARDDGLGRGLATHAGELETALTRRIRRWARSEDERRPAAERTDGDSLPEELGSFLRRHARQIAVEVTAEGHDRVIVRLRWRNHS